MQRLDPRMIMGILLMVAASVAGALFLQRASERTAVWQVDRTLTMGSTLTSADVHVAEVALEGATAVYLPASASAVGRTLAHAVTAGELLTRAAVAAPPPLEVEVTVPGESLHMPVALRHGQRVDVWASSKGDPPLRVHRVLTAVRVAAVADADLRSGTAVVLAVPADDVKRLVVALREGALDLVRVPA